ncbi:MAG TPA: copper amine oxidase N-terminal domain-containing protein [Bacillota bacterium]|nr:copper amine oxidase N-terminal domain-containing protein [Bacillota bacterium]
MRLKRKILSILVTLSMLMALLVPLASPALAYAEYSALTTPTVPDDSTSDLGTVLIHTVAGAVYTGNAGTVNFRLPGDFEFDWTASGLGELSNGDYVAAGNLGKIINIPTSYSNDPNGFAGTNVFSVKRVAANEIQLKLETPDQNQLNSYDGYMYLYLKKIKIPAGESGEVKLVAQAPSSSGFGSNEVVVGKVGSGAVTITVDEVESFTDDYDITLRFKEALAGSFEADNESVKLRLPDGFEWSSVGTPSRLWGDDTDFLTPYNATTAPNGSLSFTRDGRDLYLDVHRESTKAMYFSVPLRISVEDETKAKYGDVTVTISGPTDASPSSLVVGKYAEMSATARCDTPTDVVAGKTEQKIGDIVIEEGAPASLTEGRTITLTLPSNAKWGALPNVSQENDLDIDTTEGNGGFDIVGSDGQTLKLWVDNDANADEPGKITLEDAEVILAGDVTGDLVIEIGGTAEIETDKITVAKIKAPVTMTVSDKKEVKIGLTDQPVGEITIIESMAEAISDDENLEVWLPDGVSFSDEPTVEVTEGDLDVDADNVRLSDDDSRIIIPVDAESTVASTIKISGIKLDVDRTVPVGDIKVKVGGLAVNEVNDLGTLDDYYNYDAANQDHDSSYVFGTSPNEDVIFTRDEDGAFPGADEVASAILATCVTPAPGEQRANAVFKIGDTKYTVNGVEKTMDVAPYLKNDRTYMPVRYVAEALGVSSDNIMWNQADQTVVLIKGDRVVKLTIGSTTMYINGVAFNMDVAPELVDPGRTMLPIRWVGQALGATLTWDDATQTVTVTQ